MSEQISPFFSNEYVDWVRKTTMSSSDQDEMEFVFTRMAQAYHEMVDGWQKQQLQDPHEPWPTKRGRPKESARYCFVTISLKPGSIVWKVLKAAERLAQAKWIKSIEYTFEQRGKSSSTMGEGMHIHCLIETDKTKGQVLQLTASNMAKFIEGQNFIDYKSVNKRSGVQQYMSGIKDPDKLKSVEFDILWRKKNFIKDIYIYPHAQEKLSFEEAIQPKEADYPYLQGVEIEEISSDERSE